MYTFFFKHNKDYLVVCFTRKYYLHFTSIQCVTYQFFIFCEICQNCFYISDHSAKTTQNNDFPILNQLCIITILTEYAPKYSCLFVNKTMCFFVVDEWASQWLVRIPAFLFPVPRTVRLTVLWHQNQKCIVDVEVFGKRQFHRLFSLVTRGLYTGEVRLLCTWTKFSVKMQCWIKTRLNYACCDSSP